MAKAKRKRLKFVRLSIRGLLVLILVAAIGMAIWSEIESRRIEKEKRIQAFQLLTGASITRHNPIDHVHAINHLQSMGEKEAIDAILHFFDKHPERADVVLPIVIPFLFEQPTETTVLPDWWQDSTTIEAGVPFGTNPYRNMAITVDRRILKWLNENGKLKKARIVPIDDPFAAAETLLARMRPVSGTIVEQHCYGMIDRSIKQQVYRAVNYIPSLNVSNIQIGTPLPQPPIWEKVKAEFEKREIYWDQQRQMYATKRAE